MKPIQEIIKEISALGFGPIEVFGNTDNGIYQMSMQWIVFNDRDKSNDRKFDEAEEIMFTYKSCLSKAFSEAKNMSYNSTVHYFLPSDSFINAAKEVEEKCPGIIRGRTAGPNSAKVSDGKLRIVHQYLLSRFSSLDEVDGAIATGTIL